MSENKILEDISLKLEELEKVVNSLEKEVNTLEQEKEFKAQKLQELLGEYKRLKENK